jgi:cell division protein FtsN
MSVGGLSLSIPAIAGIAAGCVVLVVGLIVVIIVVKRRIPTEEYV